MPRSPALKLLSATAKGKRFILNFVYCEIKGLFPPWLDCSAFLDLIAERLDAMVNQFGDQVPEEQVLSHVNDCMKQEYFSGELFDDAQKNVGQLFRVTTLSHFLSTTFPVLNQKIISDFGYLRDDRATVAQMHNFARDVLRASNIMPGARIKGRHPFAWTTDANSVAYAKAPRHGQENIVGARLCKDMALEGFPPNEALFLLSYPPEKNRYRVRRPNACDGVGNLYFKARSAYDEPDLSNSGYTIDIEELRCNPLASPPYAPYEGVPEFAVEPIILTDRFALSFVGFFDPLWTICSENAIDMVIAGRPDHEDAAEEAIKYLMTL